jgi:hypothetical protein
VQIESADALVGRFPCLASYVKNGSRVDNEYNTYYEDSFCGVSAPTEELLNEVAFTVCDESCFTKLWDVLRFDAVMKDGTLVYNFVNDGEHVGEALARSQSGPVLIVRVRLQGLPQGPHWPEDEYVEIRECRFFQLMEVATPV